MRGFSTTEYEADWLEASIVNLGPASSTDLVLDCRASHGDGPLPLLPAHPPRLRPAVRAKQRE